MVLDARPRVPLAEVAASLACVLSQYFRADRRIRRLRRRRSAYSSSAPIENLEVDLDDGQRLHLVLKDLSPSSLLPAARHVRPRFLYPPGSEIRTYRNILRHHSLGTPICYGAIDSPQRQRSWLFLERVTGPLLWQMGRLSAWEQAARWLAKLHNEFDTARCPQPQAQLAHLPRCDRPFFTAWLARAERCLRRQHALDSAPTQRRFARLASRYHRIVSRLLALPTTLIHGEFYPSNVLLRSDGPGRAICAVDWERAAIGPGLVDVAALTCGDWSHEQQRRMVAAYRQALAPDHGWPPALPEMLELVESCQLHLAVQWLGWTTDWSPPKAHARNWLSEAFRLADRLGL